VDTSAEETVATDSLGRRTGPRRQHTLEEKRRIVEETHVRGASVSTVARRHNVNPNQVFAWRQLYRQGLLEAKGIEESAAPLLPVKVSTPTLMPTERAQRAPRESIAQPATGIEIKLSNGHSIVVHGEIDPKSLARLIDVLVRR
jgi:transposase-like protein